MQRNDPPQTPITASSLYTKNARNMFFGGFNCKSDDDPTYQYLVGALHACTFFVTVPVAAGVKTAIDKATRPLIPAPELEKLIADIQLLEDVKFENFLAEVLKKYGEGNMFARSDSSAVLFNALRSANNRKINVEQALNTSYGEVRETVKNDFIAEKLSAKKLEMQNANISLAGIQLEVTLTADDEAEIASRLARHLEAEGRGNELVLLKDKEITLIRNEQRQLILKYLTDGKNAGKKLQHVIKQVMDNMPVQQSIEMRPR